MSCLGSTLSCFLHLEVVIDAAGGIVARRARRSRCRAMTSAEARRRSRRGRQGRLDDAGLFPGERASVLPSCCNVIEADAGDDRHLRLTEVRRIESDHPGRLPAPPHRLVLPGAKYKKAIAVRDLEKLSLGPVPALGGPTLRWICFDRRLQRGCHKKVQVGEGGLAVNDDPLFASAPGAARCTGRSDSRRPSAPRRSSRPSSLCLRCRRCERP